MMESTLDMDDARCIEKSVDAAVTKINELGDLVRGHGYVSTWPNPLPAIRDQLSEGVTTLNSLLDAHRSALAGVKLQESTVKQQNESEKKNLNDKQAKLDQREKELRERERRLDKREGGLDAKDEQLENRQRDLDARQSKLDQDTGAHFIERGRLAEREDRLKTAEAEIEKVRSQNREALDKVRHRVPEPGTPAPGTPAPGTPAPGTPAPVTSLPDTSSPSTPASEKRKREALAHERSLKRLSQGLEDTSGDGRPMSSESAEFGAALAQGAKATEESRPGYQVAESQPQPDVQPVGSSSASGTQPVLPSASSSTPQVPRWINEDVTRDISVVWATLEFFQPYLWTDADATKLKALLKRFQVIGGGARPMVKFGNCNSQQQSGKETCYESKSANKGSGNFDNGNDNACHTCRTQSKPCFRVTRTADDSKWLITRRQ